MDRQAAAAATGRVRKVQAVSDELLDLIADMAAMYAKAQGVALPVAVAAVKRELAVARAYYRAIDTPYGDDDRGFVRWLTRQPPTPAT